MIARVLAAAVLASAVLAAQQSQPAPQVDSADQDEQGQGTQPEPTPDPRGTDESPLVVEVLPTPQTPDEAAQIQADRQNEAIGRNVTIWIGVGTVLILFCQLIVYGIQARRLRQTISEMDEIAGRQTTDMQLSIAEATRAATAMEVISVAMTNSVENVRDSVAISREIADRQELVTELQSRAYLSVGLDIVHEQLDTVGLRFQPQVVITNKGNTPAYRARCTCATEVYAAHLPVGFTFPVIPVADTPKALFMTVWRPRTRSAEHSCGIRQG